MAPSYDRSASRRPSRGPENANGMWRRARNDAGCYILSFNILPAAGLELGEPEGFCHCIACLKLRPGRRSGLSGRQADGEIPRQGSVLFSVKIARIICVEVCRPPLRRRCASGCSGNTLCGKFMCGHGGAQLFPLACGNEVDPRPLEPRPLYRTMREGG